MYHQHLHCGYSTITSFEDTTHLSTRRARMYVFLNSSQIQQSEVYHQNYLEETFHPLQSPTLPLTPPKKKEKQNKQKKERKTAQRRLWILGLLSLKKICWLGCECNRAKSFIWTENVFHLQVHFNANHRDSFWKMVTRKLATDLFAFKMLLFASIYIYLVI